MISDFKKKNDLNFIIYINIIAFIIINILFTFLFLIKLNHNDIVSFLGVSSNTNQIISKPWTLITYMFTHTDFWHVTTNMLWLYFSGAIFLKYLSKQELWTTYLIGGLFGAGIYIMGFNIFPVFYEIKDLSIAIGASASVLAILTASATYVPNLSINIFGSMNVKLKYIALIAILIDILSIRQGNSGGHLAHIGGAFYGYLFIILKNRGFNIAHTINDFIFYDKTQKNKNRNETDYDYNSRKKKEEIKINKILDKISLYGYDSLSSQEKDDLFNQK